ncbi:MAG: hypothetical protein EOQ92_10725 [Mesorhizobium sp.]|uniref:hypothetical protein n=1 Tax=Mesorhizobium sp. TaxID=1871066 RepID=UPI000FE4E345|nr:hypothetical protein [Mesorhizobium sp.]RWI28561.1 MAG: hypothetical protein EOQ92_10725 [Mesorhizobium sp.]RWK51801.1 MAG: hypothetical protein EOR47_06325 [Mesorhizobium sp.]TIQ92342.1 MAG: hypothetical protein E5X44_14855 [Mesorhizobium sp.]
MAYWRRGIQSLRIWALGDENLLPESEFTKELQRLSDDSFWGSRDQRDLLLSLKGRWNGLKAETRQAIEERLVRGPSRWKDEEEDHFKERSAFDVLNRLHWFRDQGCLLTIDLQTLSEQLQPLAPKWKTEYSKSAAASLEGRVGWVRTEKDFSALLALPLSGVISKAREISGRDDAFVENAPFSGLVEEKPVRALAALHFAAKGGEFPEWAWRAFLGSDARKNDDPKLIWLTAKRLLSYRRQDISELIYSLSEWVLKVAKTLSRNHEAVFYEIVTRIADIIGSDPRAGASAIIRGTGSRDWATEALNSPAGKISQALFNTPSTEGVKKGKGLSENWLSQVNRLLLVQEEPRCHSLVIFCRNLLWFDFVDPEWTRKHLIAALKSDDIDDRDAAWAGFFWAAKIPHPTLYRVLKDDLLAIAKSDTLSKRSHEQVLAGILLSGWANVDPAEGKACVSDDEMRDLLLKSDDEFRSHVLWQAERWSEAKKEATGVSWSDEIERLLEHVWPRQIAAKSPRISARLCNFAFSSKDRFVKRANIVLPLLSKAEGDSVRMPNLRKSKDNIVDIYPEQTLAILDVILPENAAAWPYGIESTIDRIGKGDSRLSNDPRLLSLKRRWDAR